MKIIKRIAFVFLFLVLAVIGGHLYILTTLSATEEYPADTYLETVTNKRALVVMAHDDDACAAVGTIAKLTAAGWEVKQVSFHDGNHKRGEVSSKAVATVMNGGITFLNAADETYRYDIDSVKRPYWPIPKAQFDQLFKTDLIKGRLRSKIMEFKPEIVISLDHEIGAYGHPDHVFVSKLVVDLCQETNLGIKRIYQSVYTPSMEQRITVDWMNKWNKASNNVYLAACKVYNLPKGMPTPTCSVNIYEVADKKMDYLTSFSKKEQKNLKKFLPGYQYYPSWIYFGIFDQEYFRVIDTEHLQTVAKGL